MAANNVEVERLLKDAVFEGDRGPRIGPIGLIAKAVQLLNEDIGGLAEEHSSTSNRLTTVEQLTAVNDPGLLERVSKLESENPIVVARDQHTEQRLIELERLTGMLVKSVGAWASSPQPRAVGQVLPTTSPDHEEQPATYGSVPSPYGRPSPAHAVDCVARELYGNHAHNWVEDASVEYVRGEPTLRVQVSGVLYRFRAPDVISSKEDK
jgi:hypothetical protein